MLEGTIGGRYRIIKHLGGGGFAQTYLASDQHLPGKPQCVVKQLKPKIDDPASLQTARRLFDTEADVLYQLGTHDRIPRLFAHFEENEEFYLVQEFVEGDVLTRDLIAEQYSAEEKVVNFLQDILSTLEFVHKQNVVHRDIKPSNLIKRRSDGKIVLIDFGAVKQISHQLPDDLGQATFTIAVGSAGYTPNEQIAGSPRYNSDIYALGIICIQAVTKTPIKRLQVDPMTMELVWRERAEISTELADIFDKMVRYDFRERYQSVEEVQLDLEQMHTVMTVTISTASQVTLPSSPQQNDGYLAWLERGDELFQSHRYQEAVSAYMKVVQTKANETVAWFKLGIALENLHRYEDAVAAYSQVVRIESDDYFAWLKRGKVLEILHMYEEAVKSYDRVVEIQPDNYWAWRDRGKTLEAMERYDEAITSYDRAVYLKPDFQIAVEDRKRVLSHLKRGDTLYHLQHYDEVVVSCDKAIQANPNDSLAWFMRGMALDNLQRYQDAVDSYDRVVQIQLDDHLAWFKRGATLEKLERYDEAIVSYNQVVQLQPDHYWAWYDQGRLLEKLQHFEHAIDAYDQAVRIKPDFEPAIEGRKRVLNLLKRDGRGDGSNPDTAVTMPNTRVLTSLQGLTTVNAGSLPEPPTVLAPQPQLDWLTLGSNLEASQRHEEAYALYTKILQAQRHNPEAWSRQGKVLYQLGRLEESVNAYGRAIQLNPQNADLWYRLGGALARLKRYQDALASFKKATSLQPDRPEFWYWQGRAAYEIQDYITAVAAYDRTLALKPDYQAALRDRALIFQP